MNKYRTTLWKVSLFTILLLFGMWLGPIFFPGHDQTAASELNFVSLLAAIVGGVMAAAGLVIALVSWNSLQTIDQRVEDRFNQLVQEGEAAQNERTNALFQGFSLQLESINQNDLYQAESKMEQALTYYTDLPKQLALRFFYATEIHFQSHLVDDGLFHRTVANSGGALAVYDHAMGCLNYKPIPNGAYATEAEKWLERALEHGEDQDNVVTLCLAKLYGMRERFDKMMESLDKSSGSLSKSEEMKPGIVICCAPACSDEAQLRELGSKLGMQLPMRYEEIFGLARSIRDSNGMPSPPTFIVRRRPQLMPTLEFPYIFRMRVYTNQENMYRIAFIGHDEHDVHWYPPTNGEWKDETETRAYISQICWVLQRK